MAESGTVLVVEDDSGLRELVREELDDCGYEVWTSGNVGAAKVQLAGRVPDLVISDLRLPDTDGLALLDYCVGLNAAPGFIMITAFGTVRQAVDALQRGADDFLTKPLDLDHLRLSVKRVLERRALHAEIGRYREMLNAADFHGMIGRSKPMRLLFESVRSAGRASGPVLVTGESGVGKELVARALHAESQRSDGPFLAVNCAGIPPELLESELFGHRAGAFTGAHRARKGLFAEAHGGTLLLDEIGEMPAAMQSKLLRILQDGRLRPVGDDRERRIDVRVVAATNRDLEAEIQTGRFRPDLFYRLETFALRVPPLRERGDDIDLLAAHFLARFSISDRSRIRGFEDSTLACLHSYPFPGNVRELSNAIERAVAFCRSRKIRTEDLPERVRRPCGHGMPAFHEAYGGGDRETRVAPLREIELAYVRKVLADVGGNKRRAAELLGIGRRTLYRYLESQTHVPK